VPSLLYLIAKPPFSTTVPVNEGKVKRKVIQSERAVEHPKKPRKRRQTSSGRGEESRNTGTCSTHLLSQGTLRHQLDFQFTRQILTLKLCIFTHIRSDHSLDLTGFQQDTQTPFIYTTIVTDASQVLDAWTRRKEGKESSSGEDEKHDKTSRQRTHLAHLKNRGHRDTTETKATDQSVSADEKETTLSIRNCLP
jgi:hypothetical protein